MFLCYLSIWRDGVRELVGVRACATFRMIVIYADAEKADRSGLPFFVNLCVNRYFLAGVLGAGVDCVAGVFMPEKTEELVPPERR